MTKFHEKFYEGQEVEVYKTYDFGSITRWVQGKILRDLSIFPGSAAFNVTPYSIQLRDGSKAVFSADHIREVVIAKTERSAP